MILLGRRGLSEPRRAVRLGARSHPVSAIHNDIGVNVGGHASDESRASAHEQSENLYATLAEVKHAARTNPHWRAPRDLRGIDVFTGKLTR